MKTILIVDDNSTVRKLLAVTLDLGEFKILETNNGDSALEMARESHPDLMILDVMMPGGKDGYQVCEKLKAEAGTKDIFVLLLTARGQEADKARGAEVGADDYFVKPFSPRDLLDKVYSILGL